TTLRGRGWRASASTFFIAEVVLEYLARDEALEVLAQIARLAGPTSRLACTVRFGAVAADSLASAVAAAGEPMRFRPSRAEVPDVLSGAGFEVLDEFLSPRDDASAALFLLGSKPRVQSRSRRDTVGRSSNVKGEEHDHAR